MSSERILKVEESDDGELGGDFDPFTQIPFCELDIEALLLHYDDLLPSLDSPPKTLPPIIPPRLSHARSQSLTSSISSTRSGSSLPRSKRQYFPAQPLAPVSEGSKRLQKPRPVSTLTYEEMFPIASNCTAATFPTKALLPKKKSVLNLLGMKLFTSPASITQTKPEISSSSTSSIRTVNSRIPVLHIEPTHPASPATSFCSLPLEDLTQHSEQSFHYPSIPYKVQPAPASIPSAHSAALQAYYSQPAATSIRSIESSPMSYRSNLSDSSHVSSQRSRKDSFRWSIRSGISSSEFSMTEESCHSSEKYDGAHWTFTPERDSIVEESDPVGLVDQTSHKGAEGTRIGLEAGIASARGYQVHFRNEYSDVMRRQEEEEGMNEVVDWENLFERSEIHGEDLIINRKGEKVEGH